MTTDHDFSDYGTPTTSPHTGIGASITVDPNHIYGIWAEAGGDVESNATSYAYLLAILGEIEVDFS